ncbi:uncharacterized protein LOC132708426 isoform X2 [Cylas formicarius]|nr:uncharacterized protein LOC132708426 isoform X2 [Cylas formicarius]XP_060536754.1 uncharacterized protein LOC132708426 isoform X2 [Cylas formicarius]XP_060536755.1 uncharacterized protein LOC132708426 isoform X2 [Cylas formicarius]
MLKKVKSVVDSSPRPKSPKKMSHPVPKRRSKNTLTGTTTRKKQQLLSWDGKSEDSFYSDISSSRPSTRRNPSVTPIMPLKLEPCSWEPPPKSVPQHNFKRQTSLPTDVFQFENCDKVGLNGEDDHVKTKSFVPLISERSDNWNEKSHYISRPNVESKSIFKRSADDQDYLLFLLRVTEDIISNDFYTSKDIKRIFDSHIGANMNRLDEKKMRSHLSGLCKELNVSFDEYDPEAEASICVYEMGRRVDKSIFENCKNCNALPLTPIFLSNGGDSNVLQLLDKLSLDRVTERTESCGTVKNYKIFAMEDRFENSAEYQNGDEVLGTKLAVQPHGSCEANHLNDDVELISESDVKSCAAENQQLNESTCIAADEDVARVLDDILIKTDSKNGEISQIREPNLKPVPGKGVKVIIEGNINEDDYVLLKGPVYVLKTLLDVEPKLILIKNEQKVESRRNSVDSSKTFTVSCDHITDDIDGVRPSALSASDIVKTDTELKSEVSSRVSVKSRIDMADSYSHFSDYDLTPEKETGGSDKYHHLLVDAATNMSRASAEMLEGVMGESGEIKRQK